MAETHLQTEFGDDAGPDVPQLDGTWSTPAGVRWEEPVIWWAESRVHTDDSLWPELKEIETKVNMLICYCRNYE